MATKIFWHDDEWGKLAMKLAEWRPDRMFQSKLHLATGEVEHAMKMVMPADRWKPKVSCKPNRVTPYLHSAYKRLRERNRKIMNTSESSEGKAMLGHVLENGKRMWSHAGWLAVAQELDRLYPNIFEGRLQSMRLAHFRDAQNVLPPELRKDPKALDAPRIGLLKAWDRAAKRKHLAPPKNESLRPEMAPKKESSHLETQRETRTQWDMEEWMTLAAEIDRINPHQKFIESKTLASLKPSDIRPAMNALPVERRRDVIAATVFKNKLLQAFAMLRTRRAAEALLPPKVEIEAQPEPTPAPPLPELNKYEAAFAPLIKLLAEEVANALLPRVSQMMHDMLQSSAPSEQPDSSQENAGEDFNGSVKAANKIVNAYREKLPRIAVIGPKGQLQRRLENTFKNVAFSFIDASNHPSRRMHDLVRNCDRVIGVTKFISHATEGVISKEVGDRYQAVHGGVTSIEQQIRAWMANGAIANVGNMPISM